MHGKSNMTRRVTPQTINRRLKAPATPSTPEIPLRVDVGDWALAQDEDGALIIHNVITGTRIVLARS